VRFKGAAGQADVPISSTACPPVIPSHTLQATLFVFLAVQHMTCPAGSLAVWSDMCRYDADTCTYSAPFPYCSAFLHSPGVHHVLSRGGPAPSIVPQAPILQGYYYHLASTEWPSLVPPPLLGFTFASVTPHACTSNSTRFLVVPLCSLHPS
jgi:hypothetical protein